MRTLFTLTIGMFIGAGGLLIVQHSRVIGLASPILAPPVIKSFMTPPPDPRACSENPQHVCK